MEQKTLRWNRKVREAGTPPKGRRGQIDLKTLRLNGRKSERGGSKPIRFLRWIRRVSETYENHERTDHSGNGRI